MSVEAINWVFKQTLRPSSVKFVLVALADNAGDTGECWPSVATICEKTSQDRKTVLSALGKLIELGLIEDTSKRMGQTHQVKIYRLIMKQSLKRNCSVFPVKQSRFSVERVPKTGHGTISEPSLNHKGESTPSFRKYPSEAFKAMKLIEEDIRDIRESGSNSHWRDRSGELTAAGKYELKRLRELLAKNREIACQ